MPITSEFFFQQRVQIRPNGVEPRGKSTPKCKWIGSAADLPNTPRLGQEGLEERVVRGSVALGGLSPPDVAENA